MNERNWNAGCAVSRFDRRMRVARAILMLANGDSYSTIEATVPCFRDYVNRSRRRFLADRVDGLQPRYKGTTADVLTPAMEARVLDKTRQAPSDVQAARQHAIQRWHNCMYEKDA